jgi:hypothetical protein
VPGAVHLDHGADLEQIQVAVQAWFTSVMIDVSLLPFAENVALTRQTTRAAHAVGLSVKAGLGTIGHIDLEAWTDANPIVYTDPDDAVQFVEQAHRQPGRRRRHLSRHLPIPDDAQDQARPAATDRVTGHRPTGAARWVRQPERRDRRGCRSRSQQNQYIRVTSRLLTTPRCCRLSRTSACANPTRSPRRASGLCRPQLPTRSACSQPRTRQPCSEGTGAPGTDGARPATGGADRAPFRASHGGLLARPPQYPLVVKSCRPRWERHADHHPTGVTRRLPCVCRRGWGRDAGPIRRRSHPPVAGTPGRRRSAPKSSRAGPTSWARTRRGGAARRGEVSTEQFARKVLVLRGGR